MDLHTMARTACCQRCFQSIFPQMETMSKEQLMELKALMIESRGVLHPELDYKFSVLLPNE